MKLIVLGAPGAGKGTQARNLAQHYKIPHISTSDVLREFLKNAADSVLAEEIRNTMATGGLVSDEVVVGLVKERLKETDCLNGYIFDGFPRNLNQAEELEKMQGTMDHVVYVHVPDELIIERISGRLVCPKCNAMYHTHYFPPRYNDVCDKCGVAVTQREDDKTRTVTRRLALYHELTAPIVAYYRQQNILKQFDGIGKVEDITAEIIKALS